MKKISEQGFSVVEALLVVVVASALVGIGWFAYNKYQSRTTSTTSSASTAEQSTNRVIKLPNLGIQIKLDDKVSDATYVVSGNKVYLSTEKLEKFGDGCKPGADQVAHISSFSNPNGNELVAAEGTNIQAFPDAVKVGGTYYVINTAGLHQTLCEQSMSTGEYNGDGMTPAAAAARDSAVAGFESSTIQSL